jgi:pimeloyl-ACP methyl ester carboxylesterase
VAGGPARRDTITYQAAGGSYAERVLAACGHSPHLERPREFTGLVTDFLAASG